MLSRRLAAELPAWLAAAGARGAASKAAAVSKAGAPPPSAELGARDGITVTTPGQVQRWAVPEHLSMSLCVSLCGSANSISSRVADMLHGRQGPCPGQQVHCFRVRARTTVAQRWPPAGHAEHACRRVPSPRRRLWATCGPPRRSVWATESRPTLQSGCRCGGRGHCRGAPAWRACWVAALLGHVRTTQHWVCMRDQRRPRVLRQRLVAVRLPACSAGHLRKHPVRHSGQRYCRPWYQPSCLLAPALVQGNHKSPMEYIQSSEPIKVHGLVVASYGCEHGPPLPHAGYRSPRAALGLWV